MMFISLVPFFLHHHKGKAESEKGAETFFDP